jgi:hypothetical protein
MPAGRLGTSGGVEWSPPLSYAINIRSLRRRRKPGTPPLTVTEMRELRGILRDHVRAYRMTHTNAATATERRKALAKVKVAAARFVASAGASRRSWAVKLLNHIAACDLETIQTLMKEIKPSGCRFWLMKKHLQLASSALWAWPPDVCLPAVRALAAMDVGIILPKGLRGRWPDPALATLVANMAPVWERVTGRSARPVSKDAVCPEQIHPFAEWLGDMVSRIGADPPPSGRVADIALAVKRDRKRLFEN